MKTEKMQEIAKLKYQLQRYQATGNGAMCQYLTSQIKKLTLSGA